MHEAIFNEKTAEVKGHGYYTMYALPMSVLNFTDHLTI